MPPLEMIEGKAVCDPAAIERLRSLPHEQGTMLGYLFEIFAQESVVLISKLTQAIRAGDLSAIETHAHTLKGNSAVVGAARLGGLAGWITEQARQDIAIDPAMAIEVRQEYDAFLQRIEAYL